ncbi:alpha/beta fold hydrolase [Flavobacterium salilacus subsp. salilacus]|uniref:alpha/beta fold hydrolase n=1 Tax=Flavobacterium TaxID=237 RepID=UPI0010756EAD|nr:MULTISPECIES: alpha/beta fold hydrolase [Flavobacterium]KAF2518205.1 alpha/beta fold hydrolase [Flavobacterium salilacus subsp. salilacus]MBE1615482.1 alpha/beta fold hydrolase [Flavobacterium sp. SaA2.13]
MLESRIEGTGKPFVILHGFLGMSDNWKTLSGDYAEKGYEVHALDMRNHGKSFHSDEFNYDVMAQDILKYCEGHNLEKIDLMGHSMGGKAAMFFAMTYPEKVNKLIIADIGTKYYRPHHQDILAGLSAVDFSQKPSRSDVEEVLKEYVPDFGTRQFLMKSLYWKMQGQLAFRFNLDVFNKNPENIGEALPEAAVYNGETLFLKGEKSNYINEEDTEGIKKHFPNAEIVTIKNAGHWLHAENSEDFLRETLAFLNQG